MLQAVFDALFDQGVGLEGMLLKPNMVIAGQDCARAGVGRRGGGRPRCARWAGTCRPRCPASSSCPAARTRAGHRAPQRHQPAGRAEALEAQLLLRSRAAGRGARGLAGQAARTSSPASAPSITAPSATAPPRWAAMAAPWRAANRPLHERGRAHGTRTQPCDRRGAVAHATGVMHAKEAPSAAKAPGRDATVTANQGRTAVRQGAGADERLLARVQLPLGGDDLPQDNPLLKQPLKIEDVKHRLLGHWGASPALSFVWVHLNRLIVKHDLDVIFVAGPGHGAPGVLGPAYLEGTYSEIYPDKSEDEEGHARSSSSSSPSPATSAATSPPRRPARSTKAASSATASRTPTAWRFDNPDLIVACVVGDGEAETGPLATAWHSNKFINPVARRRGAADPEPQRLQDRQPDHPRAHQPRGAGDRCSSATATSRTSSRAATRRRCTRRWPRRWSGPSTRSAPSRRRRGRSNDADRARAGR